MADGDMMDIGKADAADAPAGGCHATDKLAEGIRNFTRDTERLEALIADMSPAVRAASG